MITNLITLRAQLVKYLDRNDLDNDLLNGFIDVGRRTAARIKAREQEITGILTLDANLFAPLPDRFMSARMVYTEAGINVPQIGSAFASIGTEGGYRINGQKIELFGGGLAEGSKVELHYYEFPSALIADTDTNAFLLANADYWLWQAVIEGARYTRNKELFEVAVDGIKQLGEGIERTANEGRQHGGPRQMKVRG